MGKQPTLTMMRKRIASFLLILTLCTCGLGARLFYLQVLKNEKYQAAALTQRLRELEIQPKRGLITDRNGKPLAINVSLDTVVINPSQISEKQKAAEALATALALPQEQVLAKIEANTSFEYLARKIDPSKSKAVRALKMNGVYMVEESRRSYPNGQLLSHVLGFAGIDNQGLEGLELVYDTELRGTMGRFLGETDAYNREIPGGEKKYLPSKDGCNLALTIDEVLQHIAEREIDKVMEETEALGALIIMSDPVTGEILALANRPAFDPNNPTAVPDINRRNLAVWYNYEPGSTFKIFTAAAALEEGVVSEHEGFHCRGSLQIAGHHIGCISAHGSQTFAEVVKNSCNVGFMVVGTRMPKETLYKYIADFGFGASPGSSMPGEEDGILQALASVGPVEHANISFGQGIAVTPLQMIGMVGAVANGGTLMKPQIVHHIKDADGSIIEPFTPEAVRQVVSPQTAHTLSRLLEQVVQDGTGRSAHVPGYRLAGKTGTSQKSIDGRYVSDKHVASFIGYGPSDDPRLAVLVLVDEPQGQYYGGTVAAPVFKRIMEDSFRYLSIAPSPSEIESEPEQRVEIPSVVNLPVAEAEAILKGAGLSYRIEGEGAVVIDQTPPARTVVAPQTGVILHLAESRSEPGLVTVPSAKGLTIRQVAQMFSDMGLVLRPVGSGLADGQDPPAGSQVPGGSLITVEFKPPTSGNDPQPQATQ